MSMIRKLFIFVALSTILRADNYQELLTYDNIIVVKKFNPKTAELIDFEILTSGTSEALPDDLQDLLIDLAKSKNPINSFVVGYTGLNQKMMNIDQDLKVHDGSKWVKLDIFVKRLKVMLKEQRL